LYRPIVASVVTSLMIAGRRRPPAARPRGAPVGAEYKIGIDDVLDIAV
jgi:hypothetical protein